MEQPRVLVVEDDPVFREMVAEFLGRYDFAADVAASRDQAMDLARRHCYGAALVDLNLKRHHGLDVAGELRRSNPALGLIFISGDLERFTAGRAFPPGSYRLPKPLDLTRLRALLHEILGAAGG